MRLTFINSFHNTEATILVTPEYHETYISVLIPQKKFRKIERKLCGMKDCRCRTWDDIKSKINIDVLEVDYK